MFRLNIGSGESNLEGFINIDVLSNEVVKPDLVHQVGRNRLPYEDESVDEIWMIHSIEHIELYFWDQMFNDFSRVLKPQAVLLLSYPEFSECSRRFISNEGNKRDFWRKTLYGRQLWPGDYHVSPIHSPDLKDYLETHKFYRVAWRPESPEAPYNSTMVARRDPAPVTKEDVIRKELNLDRVYAKS